MGSAVSLKSDDGSEPTRGLPSRRGLGRDSIATNAALLGTPASAHETTVNGGEDTQMMPLARHGSLSVPSIPSSISSLEHASPVVTPSPSRITPMGMALQRACATSAGGPNSRGKDGGARPVVAKTAATNSVTCGARPPSSSSAQGAVDGALHTEEMAVMAAALMKPYHTICRKLGNSGSSRACSAALASHTVERFDHVATEVDGDSGESQFPFTKADTWMMSLCMQALMFVNPPLDVSEGVAATYPARWLPSVTPCFDEGLLFRIEWRRRSQRRLPSETGDYAHVVWCFHNSTPCYEMEIETMFDVPAGCGTTSPLRGWGETKVSWTKGEKTIASNMSSPTPHHQSITARTVCPPLSTVGFVMGRAGAFQMSIRGIPVLPGSPKACLSTPVVDTKSDEEQRASSSEDGLRMALKAWGRFVDPEFPPNDHSLYGETRMRNGAFRTTSTFSTTAFTTSSSVISWLRTSDIVARLVGPSYVPLTRMHQSLVPIIDPLYIEPGELGDSWLVGAMAAVAEHPAILLRMFRHAKSLEHAKIERAAGAFRVILNIQGWWRSILIDDFLPVTAGNYPKFAHSRRDVRELWMGLLEKAFAKVCGGYANIVAGDPLDALHMLTGWPCARYDIANFKDIAAASSAFASRLLRYDRHGLQIVFHTAPHLSPTPPGMAGGGGVSLIDPALSSDEDCTGGGNGLVPGMVYAVLRILQFSTNPFRAELTLLQVRNIWGDVAAWKGRWRCGSPRWAQWPKVAEACCMPIHPTHKADDEDMGRETAEAEKAATAMQGDGAGSGAASPTTCTCRREKYIWLEWNEVYRYFSGCGVVFRLALHHDYRVQGVFDGVRPSVCLRVTVTSRSFVGITLSMQGTAAAEKTAPRMDNGGAASAHPPIMVSLAREQANVLRIVRNSQLDPDNPTPLFTFMQVSDVSLLFVLTPEDSPYWVIPRMLASAPSTSATDGATAATATAVTRHPYVLGYFQKDPAGIKDGSRVEFVQLPATSPAFQNSTCFSLGGDVKPVRAKFQVKSPQGSFPSVYIHSEVSEELGTPMDEDSDAAAVCM